MTETKHKRARKKRLAKLKAHVTHLELAHRMQRHIPVPIKPTLALMRAQHIPVPYYRYLYEMVGKPWHWEARRKMTDKKLDQVINGPQAEIHVLYADGCPAGFFELNTEALPDIVSIPYFGLGKAYQGVGVGKWFLSAAIGNAWVHNPQKLTVTTNTLDHPAALPLYQKLGFVPVAVSDEEITPWE